MVLGLKVCLNLGQVLSWNVLTSCRLTVSLLLFDSFVLIFLDQMSLACIFPLLQCFKCDTKLDKGSCEKIEEERNTDSH